MAMFSFRLQADGSVAVESRPWGDCKDRIYFRNEIPKGFDFILPYDELIKYSWIETTDAGLFARGGKLDPNCLVDIPDFLRKDFQPDEKG